MSLTQHLHRPGALRSWWEVHSRGLQPYLGELAALARRDVRLSRGEREHAALVGGIVGRRIEVLTEPAPPYAALHAGGRRSDACWWPTHAALLDTAEAAEAAEWRPTPDGWRRLVASADRGTWSPLLRDVATAETTADDPAELIEAAASIAALEAAYRSGGPVVAASDEAISDARRILGRLDTIPARLAELCGGTLRGHAAPVLAPHWADGDVLVGPGRGGAYGLFDVKTVGAATLRTPERTLPWLWQLLSYAAADAAEDVWRIRAVGVLLPRQDAVLVWPVRELWQAAEAYSADIAQLTGILRSAYHRDYLAAQRA
ncbi:hypothetical protein BAY59_38435 (plasmid) [Prauserella coralliicola]|nr:hypothetical protein BAY59_38435 [Prauserella coralliicola]